MVDSFSQLFFVHPNAYHATYQAHSTQYPSAPNQYKNMTFSEQHTSISDFTFFLVDFGLNDQKETKLCLDLCLFDKNPAMVYP